MCVYVYILYTSYIADAVGYPIPNVPLCSPHYLLSQTPIPSPPPPSSANVDKAQPEVAALPLVQGGGGVTNPPHITHRSVVVVLCCAISLLPSASHIASPLSSKFYFTLLCFKETLVVAVIVIESILLSKLISDPLYLPSDRCHIRHSPNN